MLELDYLNSPVNSYTGMSWGGDSRLWYGWFNEEESEPERAEKVFSRLGDLEQLHTMYLAANTYVGKSYTYEDLRHEITCICSLV